MYALLMSDIEATGQWITRADFVVLLYLKFRHFLQVSRHSMYHVLVRSDEIMHIKHLVQGL